MEANGLITRKSPHPYQETVDRLVLLLQYVGLEIFAQIDHSKGARVVDMPLRPTDLILFGHPRGGTPLMQENQTAGIDLPLKALIWEDEKGEVWLTTNDPDWIADRHQLGEHSRTAIEALKHTLELFFDLGRPHRDPLNGNISRGSGGLVNPPGMPFRHR
jgi:uncharacterized protein (DUF302 family)